MCFVTNKNDKKYNNLKLEFIKLVDGEVSIMHPTQIGDQQLCIN